MKEFNTKRLMHALQELYRYQSLRDQARKHNPGGSVPEWIEEGASKAHHDLNCEELRLNAIIAEAQAKARVRTIDARSLADALDHIEGKLDITKKALNGTRVYIDFHAQDFPNAYKGIPESTQVEAIYRNGSWRITWIGRRQTQRASRRYHLELSDTAREALLNRFTDFC